MQRVLTVVGTRPEVVKMAPVIRELGRHPGRFESVLCTTAQHREMLDQMLDVFGLEPDHDLDLMESGQETPDLLARSITRLDEVIGNTRPDWVLVQGDTSTVLAAGLAAFHRRTRLAHVEAGLRTRDKWRPFPEEMYRRLTSVLADLHFAPTERACRALVSEGVPEDRVLLTGNTVVDALHWILEQPPPPLPDGVEDRLRDRRLLLVTGHRRESFGDGIERICLALGDLAERHPDLMIVYPVHLNPNVRGPVRELLAGRERILLLDPLPYPAFVHLMRRAAAILTDSGGIQEEAPSLGRPVLVMREVTERPEALNGGGAVLVGTDREAILAGVGRALENGAVATRENPFGDGRAAERIVGALDGRGA